jgi:carbamoyltransferase
MTAILGISAYYHDSAAALIVEGNIVAAAQEERFTSIKNDSAFPIHAIGIVFRKIAGFIPLDWPALVRAMVKDPTPYGSRRTN